MESEAQPMTVADLLGEKREEWGLKVAAGKEGLAANVVATGDINRPGMALAGYTGVFLRERIQIVGSTELSYLATMTPELQHDAVRLLFSLRPPCVIVTKGLSMPGVWKTAADEFKVPVMTTPMDTTPFIHALSAFIDYRLAPKDFINGELVDVFGVGLLITGDSGIGKSECALDLVDRGHRLIADDLVKVLRRGTGIVMGYSAARSSELAHHIEIRGVGIVDVYSLYGVRAIRIQKRIEVEVKLVHWKPGMDYERTGIEEKLTDILGVRIPRVTIPVIPGKNLALVLEVIAKNHILKVFGYQPAKVFDDALTSVMSKSPRIDPFIADDPE
jgi:HPr kinase/phosphorylase